MTTFPVIEEDIRNGTNNFLDDPLILAAIAESAELESAINHFNTTSGRIGHKYQPAAHPQVVSNELYEYDVNPDIVFEPPEYDPPTERDFFNPEETLDPSLFEDAKVSTSIPESVFASLASYRAAAELDYIDTEPENIEPNLNQLEFEFPQDVEDFEEVSESLHFVAPEVPANFANTSVGTQILAVPILVAPLEDEEISTHPRRRSVMEILDDADDSIEPPELSDFANNLYIREDVAPDAEVLDVATVAVDAKKRKFGRKEPKSKKDNTPKAKAKPVKEKRRGRKPERAKNKNAEKPADSRTSSSARKRKRLLLSASAVLFAVVFVLLGGLVGAKAIGFEPSAVNTSNVSPALNDTDLVISKKAAVSTFNKGDIVVVHRPDSTIGYGLFYSADKAGLIKIYNNVDLHPVDVAVEYVAHPKVTVPSIGTEATFALNTPIPAIVAAVAFFAIIGSVLLHRKV